MNERNMWISETGRNRQQPNIWTDDQSLGEAATDDTVILIPAHNSETIVVEERLDIAAKNLIDTGKAFDDIAPRSWLKY